MSLVVEVVLVLSLGPRQQVVMKQAYLPLKIDILLCETLFITFHLILNLPLMKFDHFAG